MSRRSDRLVGRLRQLRGTGPTPDVTSALRSRADEVRSAELQARVAHLEQLVQGLQDSVYRESRRQEKRIADLEAQVEPVTMAAALSEEARRRGL
ncbi:MAG TPA: hypothetical protein VFN55_01840 [Solirubrobacteraceae bacterium]|nr:hypothetical protein [Solirubrobacteraceae bacterium]